MVMKLCITVRVMLVSVMLTLLCRRIERLELVDRQENVSSSPELNITGL